MIHYIHFFLLSPFVSAHTLHAVASCCRCSLLSLRAFLHTHTLTHMHSAVGTPTSLCSFHFVSLSLCVFCFVNFILFVLDVGSWGGGRRGESGSLRRRRKFAVSQF